MAKKPSITTISSGYASTTALNDNFEALKEAFDNTLSRDGSTPNTMGADLDMNGNDIVGAGSILVGGVDYLAQSLAYKNAAETAKTAAEAAKVAAELAYDNFDDRYLGAKTSDPSTDNDGNALLDGALYFDTTLNVMKVYDSGNTLWKRTTPTTSEQANIDTVSGISSDVTTVAGNNTNVTTVADNITDVNSVATNMAEVLTADTNAATATTKAAEASASATAAANSATSASTSATTASNQATAAATSASNAATSESNASTSAANAATSATSASGSASTATTQASNAASSASAASTSETNSANSAAASATSASNAAASATAANSSQVAATQSANLASTKASEASTSASDAATSATAAAASYDSFDDRYLGVKTTAPTTDNDGDALTTGCLYYNSTIGQLYIWDGSAWDDAALSASGAVTAFNTRTGSVTLNSTDVANASGLLTTGGTMTGNLSFGDNDKAIFGAGSDLQIYHDGSNSYISEVGVGQLFVDATSLRLRDASSNLYLLANSGAEVELFYNGDKKFETTNIGADVIGSLDVVKGSVGTVASFSGDDVSGLRGLKVITSTTTNTGDTHSINAQSSTGILKLSTNNDTQRLVLSPNGDISFYEDTGTTAKFFWDASAESLGIGTSSPDKNLHIEAEPPVFRMTNLQGTSSLGLSMGKIEWETRDSSAPGVIAHIDVVDSNNFGTTFDMAFATGQSGSAIERLRIDSSGNVGIGTSSPQVKLQVNDSGTAPPSSGYGTGLNIARSDGLVGLTIGYNSANLGSYLQAKNFTNSDMKNLLLNPNGGNVGIGTTSPSSSAGWVSKLVLSDSSSPAMVIKGANSQEVSIGSSNGLYLDALGSTTGSNNAIIFRNASGNSSFAASERMRIDSSGNLLVNQTSTGDYTTTVGSSFRSSGFSTHTADANAALLLNRLTSDGDIAIFRKDNTTVGSIGALGGDMVLGTGDVGFRFDDGSDVVTPWNISTNSARNSAIDLGHGTAKFKDAYFSGTVNAANFNTTSDATLKTNVETLTGSLDAVKAMRGVSFDWIESGNSEVGVIAQEVEAVVPDVVSTDDQGIKSVKYGNLVGVLIEAIKEQQAQIDELKARLGD